MKLFLVCAIVLAIALGASAQACPYAQSDVDNLDFSPARACIFSASQATSANCDACICSFIQILAPLAEDYPIDCQDGDPATLNNLVNACQSTFSRPLGRDLNLSLFQMASSFQGAAGCPTDPPAPQCVIDAYEAVCSADSPAVRAARGESVAAQG